MSLFANFGVLRTIELRRLLEDEEKLNQIVTYSQKFQELEKAAGNMLISNYRLAKTNLSQKPAFKDAKLLLATKYKELEKLVGTIQTKQDQLETYRISMAQSSLLKKIAHDEEECEVLFQQFLEGKTQPADFVERFQNSRKLCHIRLVLVRKIQEIVDQQQKMQRVIEIHPNTERFSNHNELPYHSFCSQTSAIILPAICHSLLSVPLHPPFLLPVAHPLQPSASCFDSEEPVCHRLYEQVFKWPARPTCLQTLKAKPGKSRQAPH